MNDQTPRRRIDSAFTVLTVCAVGLLIAGSLYFYWYVLPLWHLHREIEALVSDLENESPEKRGAAASELGALGPLAKEAVPALITALNMEGHHADIRHRLVERRSAAFERDHVSGSVDSYILPGPIERIVSALNDIAPGTAEQELPAILHVLDGEYDFARDDAAGALREIGPPAVPRVIKMLQNGSITQRTRAVHALAEIGPQTDAVIPALIDALMDEEPTIRSTVVNSLGWIRADAENVVPAMTNVLKDEDETVRCSAANALGLIGPDALAAVPALTEALNDQDKSVREAAVDARKAILKTSPK